MLPEIQSTMSKLLDMTPKEWGKGWADDVCLTRFLEAVCLRYLAYPDENSVESDKRPPITAYDFRFASDSFAACALTCNAF
jgi:predicted DNA-binding ribbon-helix-helix protein